MFVTFGSFFSKNKKNMLDTLTIVWYILSCTIMEYCANLCTFSLKYNVRGVKRQWRKTGFILSKGEKVRV